MFLDWLDSSSRTAIYELKSSSMRDVWNTGELSKLDKTHLWHPFTPMQDWCALDHDPLILVRGEGAILEDSEGRRYLDGNSSIWTNIHGHAHPKINKALHEQLGQVSHVSFLGTTNAPAIELATALAGLFPSGALPRVFLSDDGSTAIEAAMKMAVQFWQLSGRPERSGFIAFDNAYHGDTLGAASLGGISTFHKKIAGHAFPVSRISDPDELDSHPGFLKGDVAAVVIEPLIQGAAGMRTWPPGLLKVLRAKCDSAGVFLILDEVMTGFGRTGTMFACEQEGVIPDFLCLAKGLTGGYIPLAATLTTERVFEAFLGRVEEMKTFYYGHSYSGNPLGCAAALASLKVFKEENVLENLQPKISLLSDLLEGLKNEAHVHEIRQCGFIAGIEVRHKNGEAFPWADRVGAQICHAARKHGLLTRPVLDTIVFMPPLCTTADQLQNGIEAIRLGMREVLG
jgi:adenosylmethionine-8-amino-7-oxononanoate aminotransferase